MPSDQPDDLKSMNHSVCILISIKMNANNHHPWRRTPDATDEEHGYPAAGSHRLALGPAGPARGPLLKDGDDLSSIKANAIGQSYDRTWAVPLGALVLNEFCGYTEIYVSNFEQFNR